MTAVKKHRIVGTATPPIPREPDANQLMSDLEQLEGIALRAAIELRAFGLGVTADALCDEIERIHRIRVGVLDRLRDMDPTGAQS